jgi:cytochrome c5
MSDHDHDFPKTTVTQFVLALLGGLFAPGIVIFLIVKLVLGVQNSYLEDSDPAVAAAKVVERIQPVAEVNVADANAGPHVDKSGEQVVKEVCSACHAIGALGSPKIGDKAAWGPRLTQGYETLTKHATEGIRQMPARGGNAELTDIEVAGAVAYMANQAGANFKAPEPKVAESKPAESKPEAAPAADPAKK